MGRSVHWSQACHGFSRWEYFNFMIFQVAEPRMASSARLVTTHSNNRGRPRRF
jgi:hypothetical protein